MREETEMTNKELREYLAGFEDDADVAIIAAWPKKRKVYEHEGVAALTDSKIPAIILGITNERDMDEEEKKACEECEKRPELPKMKNNVQRKTFLKTYHDWPVWFAVPEADETYYRYDLPDGSGIVICEYKRYLEHLEKYGMDPETIYTREYLLRPGYRYLEDCRVRATGLVDHLKEVQKTS